MKTNSVTETELTVLQFLWEFGEKTSSEVAHHLYQEVSDPKRSSAKKLLERLEWKDYVGRNRSKRPHRFHALLSRDDYVGRQIQTLANKLYGGSICPVLTSLVRAKGVGKSDLAELRKLIDDRSKATKRKPGKRST